MSEAGLITIYAIGLIATTIAFARLEPSCAPLGFIFGVCWPIVVTPILVFGFISVLVYILAFGPKAGGKRAREMIDGFFSQFEAGKPIFNLQTREAGDIASLTLCPYCEAHPCGCGFWSA